MTRQEFEDTLTKRFEKHCCEHYADCIIEYGLFSAAMDISSGSVGVLPFRAAYGIETAFFRDPDRFSEFHLRIAEDYVKITSDSVMRHYGKLLTWLLRNRKVVIPKPLANDIAETAAMRLLGEKIPVAVKVWSLEILHLLSGEVGWIDKELPGILESISIDPTPAMAVRLRRLRENKGLPLRTKGANSHKKT